MIGECLVVRRLHAYRWAWPLRSRSMRVFGWLLFHRYVLAVFHPALRTKVTVRGAREEPPVRLMRAETGGIGGQAGAAAGTGGRASPNQDASGTNVGGEGGNANKDAEPLPTDTHSDSMPAAQSVCPKGAPCKSAYLADGVHPNDAGYAVMARVWFDAISDQLR